MSEQTLTERIDEAIRRVTSNQGCMRIPADQTDPDIVLLDCKERIAALETLLREAGLAWQEYYANPACGPKRDDATLRLRRADEAIEAEARRLAQ